MSKQKIIIRGTIFVILGSILFLVFQNILDKKWNRPFFNDNDSASLTTFYSQDKDVDQVIFIGTSHSEYAISPMQIYEDTGIVTYNLSTSAQSIEVTYYLLKSAFERQSPKVVVLDASNLFYDDEIDIKNWRYVLDEMPLGKTKLAMARKYAMLVNDTDTFNADCRADFINSLVPMFQYHTRWSELTERDFEDVWDSTPYVTAGYYLNSHKHGSFSVDDMNNIVDSLEKTDMMYEYSYGESDDYIEEPDVLYSATVNETKYQYLKLIDSLCQDNGASLVLVKYPSVNNPIYYASSWTKARSDEMKKVSDSLGIDFLDFLYDIDIDFDNSTDFADGGMHMNYLGAQKVSAYMSNYLQSEYQLTGSDNETFDKNREIYDKLTDLAEAQLSDDCAQIMDYLVQNKDKYIICIAASDDMQHGLGREEVTALHNLGLKADYDNDMSYRDSYIAVIDQGDVVFEKLSNRRISYDDTIGDELNGIHIEITSSGFLTKAGAEILVDGDNYSLNNRGINIVVIDEDTSCVVISKSIDTFSRDEHCVDSGDNVVMLQDYWEELIK